VRTVDLSSPALATDVRSVLTFGACRCWVAIRGDGAATPIKPPSEQAGQLPDD
jgi:hypothetical protein